MTNYYIDYKDAPRTRYEILGDGVFQEQPGQNPESRKDITIFASMEGMLLKIQKYPSSHLPDIILAGSAAYDSVHTKNDFKMLLENSATILGIDPENDKFNVTATIPKYLADKSIMTENRKALHNALGELKWSVLD
jgi:hypothetical protein